MEELNKTFTKMNRSYRLSVYLLLIAIVAGVIMAIAAGALCLPFFAAAIVAGVFTVRTQKKFKDFYVHNIIGACVNECTFIEGISYDTDKGIPESTVAATGMIRTGDDITTNDLITGAYNGTQFAQSTVNITETVGTGSDRTTSDLFRGLWVCFDLGRTACCDMQIVSGKFRVDTRRNGYDKLEKSMMPNTAVGDLCFADTFTVYASDAAAARSALNGALASALMKLLRENKRPIMVMIIGSTVHIAMHNSESAFEPSIKKGVDLNSEKERLIKDLRSVTDFIGAAVGSNL